MPRRKVASAYTTQVGGVNSVPVTGTKYSPTPPPVAAPSNTTVNGQVAPWVRSSPVQPVAPPAVVDRRPAIAFGLVLALLAVGSLVGAVRQVQQRVAPVAAYAPPVVETAAPVAAVAAPALVPAPAVDVVAAYAARPTMTLYCDNVRHEPRSTREVGRLLEATPGWKQRCVAAYGWCTACQDAWYDAHP